MAHDVDFAAHCERDNRPAIEITEATIRAGAAALATYSDMFESPEEAVLRIFIAMAAKANPVLSVSGIDAVSVLQL